MCPDWRCSTTQIRTPLKSGHFLSEARPDWRGSGVNCDVMSCTGHSGRVVVQVPSEESECGRQCLPGPA